MAHWMYGCADNELGMIRTTECTMMMLMLRMTLRYLHCMTELIHQLTLRLLSFPEPARWPA